MVNKIYGKPINTDVLDKTIRDELGAMFTGLDAGPGYVILHFDDNVTAAQAERAATLLEEHDIAKIKPPDPVPTQEDRITAMQAQIDALLAQLAANGKGISLK